LNLPQVPNPLELIVAADIESGDGGVDTGITQVTCMNHLEIEEGRVQGTCRKAVGRVT
jgi:hypothetical protein